jgi:hypothetical protein
MLTISAQGQHLRQAQHTAIVISPKETSCYCILLTSRKIISYERALFFRRIGLTFVTAANLFTAWSYDSLKKQLVPVGYPNKCLYDFGGKRGEAYRLTLNNCTALDAQLLGCKPDVYRGSTDEISS